MVSLLSSLKVITLSIYIIIPFVFALIFGAFSIMKNPIHLRRLGITFASIQFAFASLIYLVMPKVTFSILNLSFGYSRFSSTLLFLLSLIILIISIISKTFILRSHRAFWSVLFLIFALSNSIILSENILLNILNIVWIIFLNYFLSITFSSSTESKENINSELKLDISVIGISTALILFDFVRYFVLNEIEFSFLNISQNLNHIHPTSTIIAFFGFLILIFKLFDFIPFASKRIANSANVNPLVDYLNTITRYIIGSFILFKTGIIFAYLYWDFKEIILCYLGFILLYYLILSFRGDSIYKFLNSIMVVCFSLNMFSIFAFTERGLASFMYSIVATITSFSLLYFTLAIISNKFKTDNFDEFKKISPKSYSVIFFIMFSILNFIGVPMFSMFSSRLYILTSLFSADYSNWALSFIQCLSIIAYLVIAVISLRIFHAILIAPVNTQKNNFEISKHQILTLSILSFSILIIGLFSNSAVNNLFFNIIT